MRRFEYKAETPKTGKMLKGCGRSGNERTAGKLLIEQGRARHNQRRGY